MAGPLSLAGRLFVCYIAFTTRCGAWRGARMHIISVHWLAEKGKGRPTKPIHLQAVFSQRYATVIPRRIHRIPSELRS
jgi:hypothetical protein